MKRTNGTKGNGIRTDGITTLLLRGLIKARMINYEDTAKWAERFGDRARVDGVTIQLDNRLLLPYFKGMIIAGIYEKGERQIIQKYLPVDEPVIELGASIGVVSCVVNRKLTSPDQHVVVEASPDLIPTLKKNRDTNGCQFTIIEAAIAYGSDSVTFFSNGLSLVGSLYGKGRNMEVPTRTLQSIAEGAGFHHFTLICDIEGSEIGLLEHEMDFIREHTGLILMETHDETPYGDDGVTLVLDKLAANGFELVESIRTNHCFRNKTSSHKTSLQEEDK
jgi:FkbM family methyltransferase